MSLRWNMNLWGFNNFGFSICVLVNIISIRNIKVSVLLRPRSDHLMWILSLNKLPFQVQKEPAYVSRVHFGSTKRFSTCCTTTSCHVLRLSSNLFAQGVWMDGVFAFNCQFTVCVGVHTTTMWHLKQCIIIIPALSQQQVLEVRWCIYIFFPPLGTDSSWDSFKRNKADIYCGLSASAV